MRIRRYCCYFLLLTSLIICFNSVVAGEGKANEPGAMGQLIERTKAELSKQKKKEKSVLNHLVKEQQALEEMEGNYTKVNHKLQSAQQKYQLTKLELEGITKNLKTLEVVEQERQARLNLRLLATYKYGPQSYLEILMASDSFGDLIYKFDLISTFVKSDLKLLEDLKVAKLKVKVEEAKLGVKTYQAKDEFQKVHGLHEQVLKDKKQISTKVKSTREELASIQNNRAKLERALTEYEQTSREIETQIKRDQTGNQGEALGSGSMIWPVKGRISSGFGWRWHPVLGRQKYHNGLDLAVPKGRPVLAANSGVVLVSGWRGGYGNFVAIDHGKGISTCYGHNSVLLVRVGERVTKGQKIALSGSTGLSTGPHVHFEVRSNGNPVSPLSYLP